MTYVVKPVVSGVVDTVKDGRTADVDDDSKELLSLSATINRLVETILEFVVAWSVSTTSTIE